MTIRSKYDKIMDDIEIKYATVCINAGYFAWGENTHALRLTSKLENLRAYRSQKRRKAL